MSVKEDLNKLIADVKFNKFKDSSGKDIVKNIEKELVDAMKPVLRDLANSVGQSVRQAISQVQVSTPNVTLNPTFTVPDIEVPEARVTITNPPIKIPDIKMPDEMNIKGWVGLMGVSLEKPLPVQLRNPDGSPMNLVENLNVFGGGSGGRGIVKISGYDGSAFSNLQNGDGRIKVSMESGSSGLTDTELRATAVPVSQVSGANWSVSVTDITASNFDIRDLDYTTDDVTSYQLSGASWSVNAALDSTSATSLYNADNRLRVSVETGGSGLTDAELRATAVPVSQLSGAIWSVEAYQGGTWDEIGINDSGNSITIDGSVSVSGSISSVVATGAVLHDAADDGHAPVKIGGHAIQTNPTAVADGDIARILTDDLGRTLTRPVQVRDLIVTAYATLSTGTETTLLAGVAGAYLDLVYIMAANTSNSAIQVDVRAVTAGNVMFTLEVPGSGTAGVALPVPIPQDATGNNWTVDMGDFSNTTLYISALFSKEV